MEAFSFAYLTLNLFFCVALSQNNTDDMKMVQSPIAISSYDSVYRDNLTPLTFHGHWQKDGRAIIKNTGRTAEMRFQSRKQQPYIIGGPLRPNEHYIFEQMHFHWGKNDLTGSEHMIDRLNYSMEAHLVHFNEKYGDFKTAMTKKDGLAVIAIFIQAQGFIRNENFRKISDKILYIQKPNSTTELDVATGCLRWMKSQDLDKYYYSYYGSLTTPPYSESVTWIIFQTPVFVWKKQVEVFRQLYASCGADSCNKIGANHRPVQENPEKPVVSFIIPNIDT